MGNESLLDMIGESAQDVGDSAGNDRGISEEFVLGYKLP